MLIVAGCTGTKFIPEGKYLYTGAEIKFKANGSLPDKSRLTAELEENIRLKPNGKLLGSRPGVWFYFITGEPKKKKGLRGFIKYRLGKAPVYLEADVPERTARALRSVLRNNGYLEGEVDFAVQRGEKTASVTYTARVTTPPYRLRNVTYEALDTVYGNLASGLRRRSLLRQGRQYRLSRLEEELTRIAQAVRDSGYYYFDPQYLIFQADTTAGERQVDLRLVFEGKVPPQIRTTYRLDTVEIVNNYAPTRDSSLRQYDTTRIGDYTYYHRRDDFRPGVILNAVNLRKDSLYRRTDHELTLSRLSNLGAFKFVTVRFTPETDNRLKARIFLTPQLKKSLRLEAQLTSKSNNFVGPALTGTFINRNFLRGAELFQWQLHTSYEIQANARQAGPVFAFEAGTEASLTLPRLVTPVRIRYGSLRYMPQTTMRLSLLLQNRVNFFQINSFNASYGYLWRETQQKNHAFYPIDLIYFQRRRLSPEFLARLAVDPFLERSTQNQAILGSRYAYTYNSQTGEQQRNRRRNNLYFNGNIDLSGNLAFLFQRLVGSQGGT
ncbi:MAG: hypothetical protein MUD08_02760, partial [Cytophagales bacterium]|nr:hypothetical protein [Cytophagales bacterium]